MITFLVVFFIAFIVFMAYIEKLIIKKFNIKKQKGLYKHVNKFHKWSEVVFFIIAFGILFVLLYNEKIVWYFFPTFYTVLSSIRAFMEWKFRKETKEYILSIFVVSGVLLGCVIIILFFNFYSRMY